MNCACGFDLAKFQRGFVTADLAYCAGKCGYSGSGSFLQDGYCHGCWHRAMKEQESLDSRDLFGVLAG